MKTSNVSIVKFTDGREVCLSYGVPVAAFIPSVWVHPVDGSVTPYGGYIKTDQKWSVTTSRHANAYAGSSARVVPDAVFVTLIHPLEGKR